jgi:hypothetical protein
VLGVPNTSVQWSVNSIDGGNAQVGTIDSTGFYAAPIALPAMADAEPNRILRSGACPVCDAGQGQPGR